MTVLLTGDPGLLFDFPDVRLSLSGQIGELTTTFGATLPARHTAIVNLNVRELLLTRYRQTTRQIDEDMKAKKN